MPTTSGVVVGSLYQTQTVNTEAQQPEMFSGDFTLAEQTWDTALSRYLDEQDDAAPAKARRAPELVGPAEVAERLKVTRHTCTPGSTGNCCGSRYG